MRKTIAFECPEPEKPEFFFEMTRIAAFKNYRVLLNHGKSLEHALKAQKGSPLGYGSEFKPASVLESVFGKHPVYEKMQSILENGSD